MGIKDAIIRVFALALSLGALMAMTCSEQFQQAARAESGSFDALAHDLFDRSNAASTPGRQAGQ